MRVDDRAVVRQRRSLAPALFLDIAEPLCGGVSERRARAHEPRERATTGLGENVDQPGLGCPLCEVTGRRSTTLCPCRPELLLHLATVRQAVLRIPHRSARSVAPK